MPPPPPGRRQPRAPGQPVPPPLPPQTPQYYLALQGKQAGPFDMPAVQLKVASGELTRETLAWRHGLPQWTPAGDVPELTKLFPGVPPPLPPQ